MSALNIEKVKLLPDDFYARYMAAIDVRDL
jgi:hypothetical protein